MEVLGAVAVAESAPYCVARMNVTPKSTEDKFRIIADLRELNTHVRKTRELNTHVRKTKFHYETLASSRAMFVEGD